MTPTFSALSTVLERTRRALCVSDAVPATPPDLNPNPVGTGSRNQQVTSGDDDSTSGWFPLGCLPTMIVAEHSPSRLRIALPNSWNRHFSQTYRCCSSKDRTHAHTRTHTHTHTHTHTCEHRTWNSAVCIPGTHCAINSDQEIPFAKVGDHCACSLIVAGCGYLDLCLVIDSSGSIKDNNPADRSYDNWELLLQFASQVGDNL